MLTFPAVISAWSESRALCSTHRTSNSALPRVMIGRVCPTHPKVDYRLLAMSMRERDNAKSDMDTKPENGIASKCFTCIFETPNDKMIGGVSNADVDDLLVLPK